MGIKREDYRMLIDRQRPLKYFNQPQKIDGYRFDSKKEASRYIILKLMLNNGSIEQLKVHPAWTLSVNDMKICTYTADFSYVKDGGQTVEDVKSMPTKKIYSYKLKKKLMEAIYGIKIVEA